MKCKIITYENGYGQVYYTAHYKLGFFWSTAEQCPHYYAEWMDTIMFKSRDEALAWLVAIKAKFIKKIEEDKLRKFNKTHVEKLKL